MTEELPALEAMQPNPQPTLETIAKLVEQAIVEQQETRERMDERHVITELRFGSLQKQLDGIDARERADFLALSGDIADVRRHVGTVEEHVGLLTTKAVEHDSRFDQLEEHIAFLTTKVTGHDARFDQVDARFDAHDKRFDQVDKRFEEIDARFDVIDQRFEQVNQRFEQVGARLDGIDGRLDELTELTTQIRDAVLPSDG